MSESITLWFGNANMIEEKDVTFQSMADSFLESEYVENLLGGWPFLRCLACHLAYDRNLSWDESQVDPLLNGIWPLVKNRIDW